MNLPQYAEFLHRTEEEKDLQSDETHLPHWNKMCQETRVSDQKTSRVWAKKSAVEDLQKIINNLLDVRNLKDVHLKHYHMSSAQFKKRTTHLDIPGRVDDLYQHVVKTSPFCNSTKPRPDRSRVSCLGAEKLGDYLLGSWFLQKLETRPLDF